MDPARFSDQAPGRLVPIRTPAPDFAFIPNPLPPAWEMPVELIDMALQARDHLGELNGLGRLLPSPEILLRPLQDREAIQSSILEGTYTTPEELHLFAHNPRQPRSEEDPANSWLEVSNYRKALHTGFELLKVRPLSLNVIKEMHRALCDGVRGREKGPGEFRRLQVGIGSDHRFVPPPPAELPALLSDLEKYINEPPGNERDRLVRPFFAHYQFETIHPFLDGNGRIGRLVLALMIFRALGYEMPWLYMSPYFEKYKEEYITKLFRVSTHGEWSEWLEFCLRGAIVSANDSILRCRMICGLKDDYYKRLHGAARARSHQLVDYLFINPTLSVTDVQRQWKKHYQTAKADVMVLCRAGILKQIPDQYPASFYAWEIFRIAYADQPQRASEEEIRDIMAAASADSASAPENPSA